MPSTRITDCSNFLAKAWLIVDERYRAAMPGHSLIITCTHRPQEEQFTLYTKGRRQTPDGAWHTDDDPATKVVTNCDGYKKISKHNRKPAEAIDFAVVLPGGKVSWDPAEYETVGAIAEGVGLVWGGRWETLRDYPHVEMR